MTMTYKTRNLKTIETLADNTKAAALKFHNFCEENNIDILIYEGIRTLETQKDYVKRGVSQTLKSYHIVGQAIDFVPIFEGKGDWGKYGNPDIKKAIAFAKTVGFEWGGDWKGFVDKPHLQFDYKGYGTDTFGKTVETPKPAPKPASQPAPSKLTRPYPGKAIKEGSKGVDVQAIQRALGFSGHAVDGVFGRNTKAAVVAYQKRKGLVADGIVGTKTWNVMF